MEQRIAEQLETLWRLGYRVDDFVLIIGVYSDLNNGFALPKGKVGAFSTDFGVLNVKQVRDIKKDQFLIVPSDCVPKTETCKCCGQEIKRS